VSFTNIRIWPHTARVCVAVRDPELGHPWLGLPAVEAIRVCSDPARGGEVAIASAWGQG
jgi:hypothetical protein